MPGGEAQPVVESAIALSFRHIDAAVIYKNATAVGAAIAASGVKRAELFVTTKVWPDQLSPDALRRAFDISLGKLGLDYVDFLTNAITDATGARLRDMPLGQARVKSAIGFAG
jgi:2,5-diketo-D-gluconate reductase B